jgi:hypothetical protein
MNDSNATVKTIDITPLGLKVPGGPERVAKAQEAWEQMQARVANDTQHFLRENLDVIAQVLTFASRRSDIIEREDANGIISDLREIETLAKEMVSLQDEFLLAVAGRPSRVPKQ